jgi:hypothetical protein
MQTSAQSADGERTSGAGAQRDCAKTAAANGHVRAPPAADAAGPAFSLSPMRWRIMFGVVIFAICNGLVTIQPAN